MANQLISPTFSLKKSLPPLNTILTLLILVFLAWAFFSKTSFRFYASFLFLFYSFTKSMWVSVIFLGVFQTLLLIPFRIVNLTKQKHIRDFEAKVNELKKSGEQTFLIKNTASKGNRVFLYYLIDFFVQFTSYVSIGRLFLTDFYTIKLPTNMLYDFVPYPQYPLQDVWFKIPYFQVLSTKDFGVQTVLTSWLIIFIVSTLLAVVIRLIKRQNTLNLNSAPASLKSIATFVTSSSFLLMILSYFLLRHFPTEIVPAIFTGDIGRPNRTLNTITAIGTFFTILWLDIPSILKKTELAKKAGIDSKIIRQTQTQLFTDSLRSASVVGLGAYFITNLIPCAFELSIFTLEIISWLSPITLDRLILRGNPKYEAPITFEAKDESII